MTNADCIPIEDKEADFTDYLLYMANYFESQESRKSKDRKYCIMLKRCHEWYIKDFEYRGGGLPEDITITSQHYKAKKYDSIEDAEKDKRNIEFLFDYPFKDRLVIKEY